MAIQWHLKKKVLARHFWVNLILSSLIKWCHPIILLPNHKVSSSFGEFILKFFIILLHYLIFLSPLIIHHSNYYFVLFSIFSHIYVMFLSYLSDHTVFLLYGLLKIYSASHIIPSSVSLLIISPSRHQSFSPYRVVSIVPSSCSPLIILITYHIIPSFFFHHVVSSYLISLPFNPTI